MACSNNTRATIQGTDNLAVFIFENANDPFLDRGFTLNYQNYDHVLFSSFRLSNLNAKFCARSQPYCNQTGLASVCKFTLRGEGVKFL